MNLSEENIDEIIYNLLDISRLYHKIIELIQPEDVVSRKHLVAGHLHLTTFLGELTGKLYFDPLNLLPEEMQKKLTDLQERCGCDAFKK